MDIKEITKESALDIKRFYIPLQIDTKCPNCGKEINVDLNGDDYLSYPYLNKPESVYCYCNECGAEFDFEITLRLKVEINPKTTLFKNE